jgi:hypothetical protein
VPAGGITTASPTSPEQRVYQQIENTADTYAPQVYNLLTQYSRLRTEDDPATSDFVGFSQSDAYHKDAKPFIIGVLPPSSNVTGRHLDRSASVASITGFADELNIKGNTSGGAGLPNGALPPDFWTKYVAMCKRLGVDPKVLAAVIKGESGFKTTAVNKQGNPPVPVAKGLNQLMLDPAKSIGMSEEDWKNYENTSADNQLYWAEKFFAKGGVKGMTATEAYLRNFGGFQNSGNPPGILYASAAYQKKYIEDHPGFKFPRADFQDLAYQQNPGFDVPKKDATGKVIQEPIGAINVDQVAEYANKPLPDWITAGIAQGEAALKGGADGTLNPGAGPTGGATTGDWKPSGSGDASTAKKTIEKTSNKDLNLTDLGTSFQAAQEAMIKATQRELDKMAKTPPLRLLVNPTSFKVSGEKIISDGNYGRNGPIIEHWGEQQDKIEGSGKLAGFYAVSMSTGGGGLTRTGRNMSDSYQNFLSLYLLYKNNGGVWLNNEGIVGKTGAPTLSVVGSIYIYYDNILYIGSFDNLSINEADTGPFTLEYSFSFTVRAWFLLDNVSDPALTFGAPPFVPPNPILNESSSAIPKTVTDVGAEKVPPPPPELPVTATEVAVGV